MSVSVCVCEHQAGPEVTRVQVGAAQRHFARRQSQTVCGGVMQLFHLKWARARAHTHSLTRVAQPFLVRGRGPGSVCGGEGVDTGVSLTGEVVNATVTKGRAVILVPWLRQRRGPRRDWTASCEPRGSILQSLATLWPRRCDSPAALTGGMCTGSGAARLCSLVLLYSPRWRLSDWTTSCFTHSRCFSTLTSHICIHSPPTPPIHSPHNPCRSTKKIKRERPTTGRRREALRAEGRLS